MRFVIHHKGAQKGPWSAQEVLEKLQDKTLDWSDYVFDEDRKDWILILEHPQFVESFKAWKKPTEKPQPPRPYEGAEWYILRDKNKYGPFSYSEMLTMLKDKKLFEYDFVWNRSQLKSWTKISELEVFKPEHIKNFKDTDGPVLGTVFQRRRYARAKYGASIILHNNKSVLRGESLEIGVGGAGFLVNSDHLQINQSLYLHFKAGDGVPPFNAVCEIVSKTKTPAGEYRYGVKFTKISQTIQQAIQKYTSDAA